MSERLDGLTIEEWRLAATTEHADLLDCRAERERIVRELDWRDENDWRKAITEWLGPQRMSLLSPGSHELEHMAQGAVVAGAILRQLALGGRP